MTLSERWADATPRERALLALAATVVLLGLGYAWLWEPIRRDLAQGERSLASAQATLERSRAASAEIAGLKRTSRTPRTPDLRNAVTRVATEHGLAGSVSALDVADGRARVTFAAIDSDRLLRLLEALGRDEQLFAVEALLAPRVEHGSVRAEFVLARSK